MDFLRALLNDEELLLDEDLQKFLTELEELEDVDLLDEDAWNRIESRVKKREIALYRYIVGTDKMMLTQKFLELAEKGKSIPSPMVKAYYPAIEMLDDIIQAGPGYVQLLKSLHSRAKRDR